MDGYTVPQTIQDTSISLVSVDGKISLGATSPSTALDGRLLGMRLSDAFGASLFLIARIKTPQAAKAT